MQHHSRAQRDAAPGAHAAGASSSIRCSIRPERGRRSSRRRTPSATRPSSSRSRRGRRRGARRRPRDALSQGSLRRDGRAARSRATCPSSASRRTRSGSARSGSTCGRSSERSTGTASCSTATPARHGFGAVAEALAPVSGFVLDDLYLAGDTVWYEAVEETIERFAPRVAVVHAGGASFLEGGPDRDGDRRRPRGRRPRPRRRLRPPRGDQPLPPSRAELAAAVPGVVIPRDGETVEV